MIKKKTDISFIFLAIVFFLSCKGYSQSQKPTEEWKQISKKSKYSVSGLVVADGTWYVVHDNKKPKKPRMGRIDFQKASYHPLAWESKTIPVDLEALAAVPGRKDEMIAMTSKGRCFHVSTEIDNETVSIINEFYLPGVHNSMELEGLGLFNIEDKSAIVWGNRGSENKNGVLYFGWIDLQTGAVDLLGSHPISVLWPEKNVRHISDLFIEPDGTCWISSASDPGDYGPFDSAVYRIGQFHLMVDTLKIVTDSTQYSYRERGYKIEALNIIEGLGYFCTDDEKSGVSVKIRNLQEK